MDNAVLCMVKGDTMYFTTQEIERQWGDDWDDAPWQHNAGNPYTPIATAASFNKDTGQWETRLYTVNPDGSIPWSVYSCYWAGPFYSPSLDAEWGTSERARKFYSAEQLNAGVLPWLEHDPDDGTPVQKLMAGMPYTAVRALVERCGGIIGLLTVYPNDEYYAREHARALAFIASQKEANHARGDTARPVG